MPVYRGVRYGLLGLFAVTVLAAGLLAGCLLIARNKEPEGPLPVPFNHHQHVVVEEMDCSDCHAGADTAAKAGYPSMDTCMGCHEGGAGDEEQPFETVMVGLSDPVAWPTRNVLPDYVRFEHQRHLAAGQECSACHGDVGHSERVLTSMVRVDLADCESCHSKQETGVSDMQCSRCHVDGWGSELRPPTHDDRWMTRHGLQARAGFLPDHGADCATCHRQTECTECHKTMEPASHDNTWRERSHGMYAGLDRQACATCHTEDSCARCHSETRPRSHTASWGGTRDRHCQSCHLGSVGLESCQVCHRAAPVHATAPMQPPSHVPGQPCLRCHGNSAVPNAKLTHPDNGEACTLCHL